MRLKNTSVYPTDEVRELIKFGAGELSTRGIDIYVKDGRKYSRGLAYLWPRRIIIWLAPETRFPNKGWKRHRNSPFNHDWKNWQEALVALAAHELMHLDIPEDTYYSKSQQWIEQLCEAYEHKILHQYRNATN